MKSRAEFIKRWKTHLAGLALCGSASEAREAPMTRASRAIEIPGEVELLLGAMYDWLTHQPNPNGVIRKEPSK